MQNLGNDFIVPGSIKGTYKGIVYLSLDCGITWNYLGHKYPTTEVWTWCSSNSDLIVNYIENTLIDKGYLPILYTYGASKEYVSKIIKYFSKELIYFTGLKIEEIHKIITNQWINKKVKELCFESNVKFFNIGQKNNIVNITNCSATDLNIGIEVEKIICNYPQLIIIVGQPGSGKSTLADRFAKKGWLILDEKMSNMCMRLPNCKFSKNLQNHIKNIGVPGTLSEKGIIIDASNPKKEHRNFYKDQANKLGVECSVGWVTRPGYYSGEDFNDISKKMYTETLDVPSYNEKSFRFI